MTMWALRRLASVAAVLLLALICASRAAPRRRPVVQASFSSSPTIRAYGDMSCYGNPDLRTPHIGRLNTDSVRLTDFHVGRNGFDLST